MSGNVKEYSELKKRALIAKQRMRMGYWQTMSEEKEKALLAAGDNYTSVHLVRDNLHAKFERDNNMVLNSSQAVRDEKLYGKVCAMLDSDEDVINPIGMLVEHEVYDGMDDVGKQRYILELSKKFREMRERYYKERNGAVSV